MFYKRNLQPINFDQFKNQINEVLTKYDKDPRITELFNNLMASPLPIHEKLACLAMEKTSSNQRTSFFITVIKQSEVSTLRCLGLLNEASQYPALCENILAILNFKDHFQCTGSMYFTSSYSSETCLMLIDMISQNLLRNYFSAEQTYQLIMQRNADAGFISVIFSWQGSECKLALLRLLFLLRNNGISEEQIHRIFTTKYGSSSPFALTQQYTNGLLLNNSNLRKAPAFDSESVYQYLNNGILPSESYQYFLYKKKEIANYIFQLEGMEKLIALENALNPDHPLGRLFWLKRLGTAPSLRKSTLKSIKEELDKELLKLSSEEYNAYLDFKEQCISPAITTDNQVATTVSLNALPAIPSYQVIDPGTYAFVDNTTGETSYVQLCQDTLTLENVWLVVQKPDWQNVGAPILLNEKPSSIPEDSRTLTAPVQSITTYKQSVDHEIDKDKIENLDQTYSSYPALAAVYRQQTQIDPTATSYQSAKPAPNFPLLKSPVPNILDNSLPAQKNIQEKKGVPVSPLPIIPANEKNKSDIIIPQENLDDLCHFPEIPTDLIEQSGTEIKKLSPVWSKKNPATHFTTHEKEPKKELQPVARQKVGLLG